MIKTKQYRNVRFTEEVLREAARVFREQVPAQTRDAKPIPSDVAEIVRKHVPGMTKKQSEQAVQDMAKALFGEAKPGCWEHTTYRVEIDGAEWGPEDEEEFFAEYRRSGTLGHLMFDIMRADSRLLIHGHADFVSVAITAPSRPQVEAVSAVFERSATNCLVSQPTINHEPTIFIGHGRSPLWRDLKDHLHEKHAMKVEAYEIGARAGHAVRDVLEEMLDKSSFALLVLTGEDITLDGALQARQNVVHEAGLFQGRLGFHRAIVLLEEGTDEFSNIHGLEQIRFAKGKIKETFGDVLATIRREFP
jgi:predicted nucleotide-binding protein